jgi:uncharacterized protein involved in exopolysaccharide biosynthesis
MKSLCLVAALVACVSTSLLAEEPAADLAAQKQALTKELSLLREEFIKNDPALAKEKAAIDDQRKALNKKADEALKADPKVVELRTKLKAVNDELKKADKK